MKEDTHTDQEISEFLTGKRVAVIGMSKNPSKAAHHVPQYLAENGYKIIPVNPSADVILGHTAYASVSDISEEIDIVNIFRPSEQVLPFVREAIKKKPRVIWLQEGIYNKDAEELARAEGVSMVFNRCMLVEHKRLLS